LLAALTTLIFLSAMIAVVMRGNVTRRERLRMRQDAVVSFCLAEAGANEAIHALAQGKNAGAFSKDVGAGRFQVELAKDDSNPGAHVIRSTGAAEPDEPTGLKRTIVLRVVEFGMAERIQYLEAPPSSQR
jgi:hypothetical protein